MKQRSDRLPAGKTFPIRGKGLPLLAAPGNAARFPRPRGKVPCRPAGPGETEASARPGGCKAPAGGGAGAGRWLWAPGGTSGSVAQWQGRWPLPEIPDIFENVRPGGIRKRDPRFPRPRGTLPCRPSAVAKAVAFARVTGHPRECPSGRDRETRPAFPLPAHAGALQTGRSGKDSGQRPARRVQSARRGRGGHWPGAMAPGGTRISVVLWQGRWPRPERPVIRENVRPDGNRKRDPRFPRPRATVPRSHADPGPPDRRRPPWRGWILDGACRRGSVFPAIGPCGWHSFRGQLDADQRGG